MHSSADIRNRLANSHLGAHVDVIEQDRGRGDQLSAFTNLDAAKMSLASTWTDFGYGAGVLSADIVAADRSNFAACRIL
jgi:hypothetical protein